MKLVETAPCHEVTNNLTRLINWALLLDKKAELVLSGDYVYLSHSYGKIKLKVGLRIFWNGTFFTITEPEEAIELQEFKYTGRHEGNAASFEAWLNLRWWDDGKTEVISEREVLYVSRSYPQQFRMCVNLGQTVYVGPGILFTR